MINNNVLNILDEMLVETKEESVKIVDLDRSMFKDKPSILDKYFKNSEGCNCWYCRIPEITKEDYVAYICQLKRKPKNTSNWVFAKATPYYLNKCKMWMLEKDFGASVDIKGYISNEEHYRFDVGRTQDKYESEYWLDKEEETVIQPNKVSLDEELVNNCYYIIFKALANRLIMLLDLSKLISMLNNIRDYMSSTGGNPTEQMLNTLRNMYQEAIDKLHDSNFIEFKKEYSDIEIYAESEDTREDYVRTYTTALRMLTDIRDEPLDYILDSIHNDKDMLEKDIIANDIVEEEPLYNNTDKDEDEELDE